MVKTSIIRATTGNTAFCRSARRRCGFVYWAAQLLRPLPELQPPKTPRSAALRTGACSTLWDSSTTVRPNMTRGDED